MASAVEIEISVDQSQFDPAIKNMNAGFVKLGKTGEDAMKKIEAAQKRVIQTTTQMSKTLSGGSTAGVSVFGSYSATGQYTKIAEGATRAAKAVDEIGHANHRAHDAANLLGRTLGIEMPRAIERLIGQSKILAPLFSGLFKASVVAVMVGIFVELIEKTAEWIDHLRGITDELEKQKQLAIDINNVYLGDRSSKDLAKQYGDMVRERERLRKELKKHRLFQTSSADDASAIYDSDASYYKEKIADLDKSIPEIEKKVAEARRREHDDSIEKLKQYAQETIAITKQIQAIEDRGRLEGLDAYGRAKETERQQIEDLMALEKKRPELAKEINAAIVAVEKGALREIRNIRAEEAKKHEEEQKQAVQKYAEEYEKRLKIGRDFNDAMLQTEQDIAALRREINGDTIGAMKEQERARVEAAVARMREIGVAESQLADYRANLEYEANLRIAREQQKLLEQSVDRYASALEDLFSGNTADKILANAKKFFFRLAAMWLIALQGGRPAQGGGSGGSGGILGGLGGILLGGGGGSGSSGGLILGGGGGGIGVGATPPFNPSASSPVGIGNNFIAPGLKISNGEIVDVSTGGGSSQGSGGFLSKLTGAFGGATGLAQLGFLGAIGAGKKFGGIPGAIGGGIAALALTASLSNGAAGMGAAGILSGLGIAPALAGPLAGGLIGFGVGSQYGKTAGGLSGAASGALVGALAFGPIGALIGGLVGLLGGIFGGLFGGGKRKKQANKYIDQTVVPEIEKIVASYKGFQIDYGTAIGQLVDLQAQAEEALKKLKGEGKSAFRNRVLPAIEQAKGDLLGIENERQRRSSLYFGPPQFHSGGYVSAYGNRQSGIPTQPGEIVAKLRDGEYVVNPEATRKNRGTLEAMNAGMTVGGATHHHHWNISAVDAKSFSQMLRDGGGKEIFKFAEMAAMEGGF
jgi:hypothetical protein